MKWYLKALKKYATFKGRSTRKEYWMFVLWNMLVSIGITLAAWIIAIGVGFAVYRNEDNVMDMGTAIAILTGMVYSLVLVIPGIAVTCRRMHDAGRSGWWMLFPVVSLILLCLDSQPRENGYGPSPKMPDLSQAVAQAA
jgi:uncharacterized membrane protein YhaH (DUF805 family)